MKFYEMIQLSERDAITAGRRALSDILAPSPHGADLFELQTCPFVPDDEEHTVVEISIADDLVPADSELQIYDTQGRHFLLPTNILAHCLVRCLSDDEMKEIAIEEIDRCILPSSDRLRDAIARCPKRRRKKEFGPWLTTAFDKWETERGRECSPEDLPPGDMSAK